MSLTSIEGSSARIESPRKGICLNMIVKNEAHIIERTLKMLCNKIQFSYWVICDTGSTDGTQDLIKNFFARPDINIAGELHQDEWSDFSTNRNLALERAYNKTEWVFIFDADDDIVGELHLDKFLENPELKNVNGIQFHFGPPYGMRYNRTLMVNNTGPKWKYTSVIHEVIGFVNHNPVMYHMIGDYYIVSGRSGARNKNPKKYYDDAITLEKAYHKAIKEGDPIFNRYAFYCANSYRDNGVETHQNAIDWYKTTLSLTGNWIQEKYVSCLYLNTCFNHLKRETEGIYYLLDAHNYDSQRVEHVYNLVQYYCIKGQNKIAYSCYTLIKNWYEKNYMRDQHALVHKLFAETEKYDYLLPYYMAIVLYEMIQTEPTAITSAINNYKIVFIKKFRVDSLGNNTHFFGNFFCNLRLYIIEAIKDPEFMPLFQGYIDWIDKDCFPIVQFNKILEPFKQYGLKYREPEVVQPLSFDEDLRQSYSTSKNILIFTYWAPYGWNHTVMKERGIGGSETAAALLAEQLAINGYTVYVGGGDCIVSETIVPQFAKGDGKVVYVNYNEFKQIINETIFHTVIISRQLLFYEKWPNAKYYQSFLWGHDVELNRHGCELSNSDIFKKYANYITGCICQTEWHKNLFASKYPELENKFTIINNGIEYNRIQELKSKVSKVANRFVYSSCVERGLKRLLELWPAILEEMGNAELYICSYNDFPKNQEEIEMKKYIDATPSIHFLGKLSKQQLYELACSAEYWLYTSYWPETSCITAMEMLASQVLCLYYPVAGLVNTMDTYGIPVKEGNEIEAITTLTNKRKGEILKRATEYAKTCSWSNRVVSWIQTIKTKEPTIKSLNISLDTDEASASYIIKVVNLKRRSDRKAKMTELFKTKNISNYEFFEAVDGSTLKPSGFIKNLFKDNDFNYRKGVIGCALSHYTLWKQLIDDKYEYYVILEDDVTLSENFKSQLNRCIDLVQNTNINHALIGSNQTEEPLGPNECIVFNKVNEIVGSGTYGYIISKNGATKMIEHLNKTSIFRAIDCSELYMPCVEVFRINKYIVNAEAYQIHGNADTDIQLDYDCLCVDNIPSYTISFTDWWIEEYCGGYFDFRNNYFTNLLSEFYGITVVPPSQNPNVMFCSIFVDNPNVYKSDRRVFYSGEAVSQDPNADFNITFDENSSKNCRLPLWVCYLNKDILDDHKNKMCGNVNIPNKTKFCSLICQTDNVNNTRSEIVYKLSKYKTVDCGGYFLNNIGYIVPRGTNSSGKIQHNNNYKFVIAFENKIYPGYVTEKICDAYKSKSIPIYWGTQDVVKDFNPSTFINANDFSNFDDLVEYIKKVDTDDVLYASYFKEPILSKTWIDIFSDPDRRFFRELANNIVGNTNS